MDEGIANGFTINNIPIATYYNTVLNNIKRLPETRRYLFLFGVRAEFQAVSILRQMLEESYKVELTKQCNCSNIWNFVITVK